MSHARLEAFFKKWANPSLFLFIFVFTTWNKSISIGKSIDGVHGIQTQGSRMEGAVESTELLRHPKIWNFLRGILN